jgi:hypothetical protein
MEENEKNIKLNGEAGQGERLLNAKLRQRETNGSFTSVPLDVIQKKKP